MQSQPERVVAVGGIDPDVVESAALAHDLGHPPFGHIAEEELDSLVTHEAKLPEGFDGNAQSFRIVTRLAMRCEGYDGLNLTRATLRALLKYPWTRGTSGKSSRKWGAFSSEKSELTWACELNSSTTTIKSAEAEIMDWADDITYAVHDASDFFRAGLIPLDRLVDGRSDRERRKFYDEVFARETHLDFPRSDLENAFEKLRSFMPVNQPYLGSNNDRSNLRTLSAGLISRYVRQGLELASAGQDERQVRINPAMEKEVIMLKQLTWHYVILNPALATQQHGQRKAIQTLFEIFLKAAKEPARRAMFPVAFREMLDRTEEEADWARIVCDYIAGMTERQALALHCKLAGVQPGSALR